ncbi:alpha/beta fold hydrolase [Ramlibacter sp.]|uniref:alpha/beta fold hydrolase n=1 Tax=Ramlibacter sp. TaxID=1917967 RepID=UPI003D0E66BC
MLIRCFRGLFWVLNAVSARLAARVAVAVFYSPRRFPAANWERTGMASGRLERLDFDDESLAATVWGESGPTVLLVHGWQGRQSQLVKIAARLVESGYRVVSFDGPAHGSSVKKRTTLVEFSEAVEHAALRFGPVYGIVGHSFGAAAAAIAIQRGLRTERAVLISCPYSLRHVVSGFARTVGLPAKAHEKMYPLMERLHRCAEGALSFDEIGPAVRAQCLLIHDSKDQYIPISDGERVSRSIVGAQFVHTAGLGHMRILQDEGVVRRVARFLAGGESEAVGA